MSTSGEKTKAIFKQPTASKAFSIRGYKIRISSFAFHFGKHQNYSLFCQATFYCSFFPLNSIYVHIFDNAPLKCVVTSNSLLLLRLIYIKIYLKH